MDNGSRIVTEISVAGVTDLVSNYSKSYIEATLTIQDAD